MYIYVCMYIDSVLIRQLRSLKLPQFIHVYIIHICTYIYVIYKYMLMHIFPLGTME